MTIEVEVLRDHDGPAVPADEAFQRWADLVAEAQAAQGSVAIRIVDVDQSQKLNQRYRDRDAPTNVLSFPVELPVGIANQLPIAPLGDLAICAPLVAREAKAQSKPESHHWAHLTMHGLLHLLGHDHEAEEAAELMESLEKQLLAVLSIPNPYEN